MYQGRRLSSGPKWKEVGRKMRVNGIGGKTFLKFTVALAV